MSARVSSSVSLAAVLWMFCGCDPESEPSAQMPSDPGCTGSKCDGSGERDQVCYTQQDTIHTNATRCIQARGSLEPGEPIALRIAEADNYGERADCDAAFSGRDDRWSIIFDEVLEHDTVEVEGEQRDVWRHGSIELLEAADATVDWALLQVGNETVGSPTIEVVFDTGRFTGPLAPIFTPIWWPLMIQMTPPEASVCAPEGVSPVPPSVETCELVQRAPVLSGEASVDQPLVLPPLEVEAGHRIVARIHHAQASSSRAVLRVRRWSDDGWVQVGQSSGTLRSETVEERIFRSGLYRVEAHSDEGDAVPVRLSFDVVTLGCVERSACLGAEGLECEQCSELPDGRVECDVSVGSQMHGSCCAEHPGGVGCADEDGDLCETPERPGEMLECCALEYDRALEDAEAGHGSSWVMDPARVTHYPVTLARTISLPDGGGVSSVPEPPSAGHPGGMRVRAGDSLRLVDAQLGWCGSGRYEANESAATCVE